jgi:hypothetical protein
LWSLALGRGSRDLAHIHGVAYSVQRLRLPAYVTLRDADCDELITHFAVRSRTKSRCYCSKESVRAAVLQPKVEQRTGTSSGPEQQLAIGRPPRRIGILNQSNGVVQCAH